MFWDGSFEYPQHMFWLRNKIIFLIRTLNLSHVNSPAATYFGVNQHLPAY